MATLTSLYSSNAKIARFFRWKYGGASVIRNNFGKIVAHTRTGVGQGDPWGSLFFEIGFTACTS